MNVLFLDIETAPILGYVWSMWQQNVGLNQIKSDWYIISWAAKWLGKNKIIYKDQRRSKKIEDDKKLLKGIWLLLDKADIVVTQNGKKFDIKKLNARFVINGFKPPSSFRQIDTLQIAKKYFAFTSNKLEYMSDKLCTNKKMKTKKFQGFELWKECLSGNIEAWREMELYNRQDVIALEELYNKLIPWDNSINFNVYSEDFEDVCKCTNSLIVKNGYIYTDTGKYQRYRCNNCGSETRGKENILSKTKRSSLRRRVQR